MSLTPRSENRSEEVKAPVLRLTSGKLHGFRLRDVPRGVRLRAGEELLVATANPWDGYDMEMAIHLPSDEVYWVSQKAWDAMMSSAAKASRKPKAAVGPSQEAA